MALRSRLPLKIVARVQGALFAAFWVVAASASSPDGGPILSAYDEMKAAINIVRENAIGSEHVDWVAMERILAKSTQSKQPAEMAYPMIRSMLESLGDHHSFLLTRLQATEDAESGYTTANPKVELRPPGIGYIYVPGFFGTDSRRANEFVTKMRLDISDLVATVRLGWVVDLRGNVGGNMWPMLQALRPLLGERDLGGYRWRSDKQMIWNASTLDNPLSPIGADASEATVAVLIGPQTASSGEAIAIAFHGRDKTRFFGQDTAGLSTGNEPFSLPDGAKIMLTTAVAFDRFGKTFGKKVSPDVIVRQSPAKRDDTLIAACNWLSIMSSKRGLNGEMIRVKKNPPHK